MKEEILSPLNRQAVAEQALLRYFRDSGVFSPPNQEDMYWGATQNQSVRIDMLIHACVKFVLEKYGDPKRVQQLLFEEMRQFI